MPTEADKIISAFNSAFENHKDHVDKGFKSIIKSNHERDLEHSKIAAQLAEIMSRGCIPGDSRLDDLNERLSLLHERRKDETSNEVSDKLLLVLAAAIGGGINFLIMQ